MIVLLYVIAAMLTPLVVWAWRYFDNDDNLGILPLFGAVFGAAAIVMCLAVPTVVLAERAVGETTCANWSEQTGYPAKFRVLNWADGGKCMARTPDGHWTLNTNIIVNVPAQP